MDAVAYAIGVLFVVLKLAGFVSWSWKTVAIPFIVGLVLTIIGTLLIAAARALD